MATSVVGPLLMQSETHGWIRLRGVRVEQARVGIYPHELDRAQPIDVDVALWTAIRPAALSQRITDTIDYDSVASYVREVTTERHYPLIESLCERLAAAVMERFDVERVSVEVHKIGVLGPGSASVAIERSR